MTSYAIHHINGKVKDNDISNLSIVDISENLGGITMINKVLAKNQGNIVILSGEVGRNGTFESFRGTRSELAINRRLAKERCNGDRWARAYIFLHENEGGKVYIDLHDTSDMRHIKDDDIN